MADKIDWAGDPNVVIDVADRSEATAEQASGSAGHGRLFRHFIYLTLHLVEAFLHFLDLRFCGWLR